MFLKTKLFEFFVISSCYSDLLGKENYFEERLEHCSRWGIDVFVIAMPI